MDHSYSGHGPGPTDPAGASHGDFRTYAIGFVISVVLTAGAFWAVMSHGLSPSTTIGIIFVLAVTQICVHLVCFLHLSFASEQRWNITAFAFAVIVVFVVIVGSLWIMNNMTERMVPAKSMPSLQQQP